MNHKEMLERFEQAGSAKIDKLFWIAGSIESNDLISLIEDFEDENWERVFPEIYKSEHFEYYKSDKDSLFGLYDFNKLGFLAEVHIPQCSNFSFMKNKKPYAWQTGAISHLEYVYAETPEELINQVEERAKYWFQYDLSKHKSKGGKK